MNACFVCYLKVSKDILLFISIALNREIHICLTFLLVSFKESWAYLCAMIFFHNKKKIMNMITSFFGLIHDNFRSSILMNKEIIAWEI